MDWTKDHKYLDIYRINHPEGKDLTYLKDEENKMKQIDKVSRLDKYLLCEDLCIKEIEFKHTRDHFYTEEYGMQGNSFNHGSVMITFNRTHPGQFKLDPYIIKTGSPDSEMKQTIYEANLFNTENAELTKLYEYRKHHSSSSTTENSRHRKRKEGK